MSENRDTKFKAGQSPNPGGRPKVFKEFQDACREQTQEALATLIECLHCEDAGIRLRAAEALLDRGWGRPTQAISGEDGGAIKVEAGVEVHALLKRLAGEGT